MASTSTAFAVGSSTVASLRWSYDVFLSFRGEDTRNNFTAHLLASLSRKGIHTFIDNERLKHGEQIAPALLKAIEGSRVAVVIFSANYASSTWCLDEISKIVECTESRGQTLIPVFYKVEPSAVRRQSLGSAFYTALEKHQERFKDNPDKVQKWKDALLKASDISGEHFDNGNEADFVEKIAKSVSKRIGRQPLIDVAPNPVGLHTEIDRVKPLMRIGELERVCFIGIVGTGGMGKTTLAKAIYNQFAEGFDGCSFLLNVREATSQQYDGLIKLQRQLLSDILGIKEINVDNEDYGITLIRQRLQNRRCLMVLDDVDHPLQIEKLAGGYDWFGPGSRIIITTRNEHLLVQFGASKHQMEGLHDDHARELLSWSAFRDPSPPTEYANVFSAVLNYSKGLPLALKVLGSSLRGKQVSRWEYTIQRLKDIPNQDICKVLKISYDGLDDDQKEIFLYIVCFFKGRKTDDVVKVLNGCGYHSEIGIEVLIERSLIATIGQDIWEQTLDMHDLIEEMGKDIARRGKKGTLLNLEEINSVLEGHTGTDAIHAISLCPVNDVPICLNPIAFEKMSRLRMLKVRGYGFSCGPSFLPNELRLLEWENYPSTSLPSDFNPKNLVGLTLVRGRITKLWDAIKVGPELTMIDLSLSHLCEIPDLSGMRNLKKLRATGCKNLVRVHESVGILEKLEYLNFTMCKSLTELPTRLRLPSLRYLSLEECEKLEKFPDILGRMDHVKALHLFNTLIKELPPSIENLTGLQTLSFAVTNIEALPSCIYHMPNLKQLGMFLDRYEELEEYEDEPSPSSSAAISLSISSSIFPRLVQLHLYENNTCLSPCISEFYNLRKLDLSFSKLKDIPEIPPRLNFLITMYCESLETIGTQSLRAMRKIRMDFTCCDKLRRKKKLVSEMFSAWLKGHEERMKASSHEVDLNDYHFEVLITGRNIPDRFYHGRSSIGKNLLRFRLRSLSRAFNDLAGFALFAAFSGGICHCNWLMTINGERVYARKKLLFIEEGGHVWIIYIHLKKSWKEKMMVADGWNHLSFEVEFSDKHLRPWKILESSSVAFIGRSDDFNSLTEIEFLGPEVAMADIIGLHILELCDEPEAPEEATIEDEDIAPVTSLISGISNNALTFGGSSSISQPLPLEMAPLQKRQMEFPPDWLSLSVQPSQDEQNNKRMKS